MLVIVDSGIDVFSLTTGSPDRRLDEAIKPDEVTPVPGEAPKPPVTK